MDKKETSIVIDTETTGVNPHKCDLLGIAINDDGKISYGNTIPDLQQKTIIGHNIKYDMIVLYRNGYKIPDAKFDTLIAQYLLHINKKKKLETIVEDVFGVIKADLVDTYNKSTGEKRVNLPEDWYNKIDRSLLAEYSMQDVEYTAKLKEHFEKEFKEKPVLKQWFDTVEMPLVNIITKMELEGVKVDRQSLTLLRNRLQKEIHVLEKRLLHLTGDKDFNLNSSKQIRDLLYTKFKLPKLGYTDKGEVSTDKDTLTQLAKAGDHAFPKLLLKYREYSKIVSTYTDTILDGLDKDDRIHTTYNQALTATRRFSSDSPNLQNIPTRSEIGKLIKACFVPKAGHKFLIADYSQLEPRILAHLSDDAFLIDCFKQGADIYEYTANIVKASGFKEFSRDRAKILFLALMYGKSSYGLSKDWHCSQEEAEAIIQSVFKKLSGVSNYINKVQETAFKTGGWLKSLAGLPLYVGDPYSNNKWEVAGVNRCAVNYPIQASSQDILKKAIVNIYNELNLVPVLMVHDELVFELKNNSEYNEQSNNTQIIKRMESAWDLKVPLKVEYKISERWEK